MAAVWCGVLRPTARDPHTSELLWTEKEVDEFAQRAAQRAAAAK
jgi:hypothetical protein